MSIDGYVKALLHFDGGITDETGRIWYSSGSAASSGAQAKFGSGSLYVAGGDADKLITDDSPDFDFGAGDFTIDWWQYKTATGGVQTIWSRKLTSSALSAAIVISHADGVYATSNGTGWDVASGQTMGTPVLNQWEHYAVVRSGDTFYTFKNGQQQATWTSSLSIMVPTAGSQPTLGGWKETCGFKGHIDEFRISKGIARWTTTFTPPTEPYSASVLAAPTGLSATAGDAMVALSWSAVSGATGYNVKRATTAGGPYTTIGNNITTTGYTDSEAVNGITYYYVVTALDASSESANSNEVSATPTALPTGNNALLLIYLKCGKVKEYEVPAAAATSFISWYNGRANGTGDAYYLFEKDFNLGPFQNRKDYIVFETINGFEVMNFTK